MNIVIRILLVGLLSVLSACVSPVDDPGPDGGRRTDRFIVYFGVLPTAATLDALATHREPRDAHRAPSTQGPETHHVVVAVFDAVTGQRITDATVQARHIPPRGVATTKDLVEMPVGQTKSYGNKFIVPEGRGHRFEIEIRRAGSSDRVTFRYDNLHGSAP